VRRTQRRCSGAVAGLGFAVLVSASAHAQRGSRFSLEWTAPAGCPDGDRVRQHAEALLGGPIEPRLSRPLGARGTVTRTGDSFALDLATIDGELRGERHLAAPTCQELAAAAALIVALAVDPKAVAARGNATESEGGATTPAAPPESATASNPPPPAANAAPVPTSPVATNRAPRTAPGPGIRVMGFTEAALAGDVGTLPGPSIGPSLSGGVGLGRFRVRLGASYFVPRFAEAAPVVDKGTRGGDVSLFAVNLAGCYAVFTPRALELGVCAMVEGGALFAAGSGFDHSKDATTPWLGAGGSTEMTIPVTHALTVRVAVGAIAPFARSTVRFSENTGDVTQMRDIHRPGSVAGRAALGVGLAFW
jgi:hypothetical protein